MADNKRIAKNTIFLYLRMIIIMAVTFYTSRIVLDKLGVDDYGIFNAVAGVIGVLSFFNNTLAKGTSRFLTFEIGNGNSEVLKRIFSTAFFSHTALMLLLLLFLESVGIWFLNNKLVIPDARLFAAQWVYQFSLVAMCISILQVPYTSSIIAHEDMSIYAYLSIGEAVGKLLIVYFLSNSSFDKMVLYSILLSAVQFLIFLVYYLYCKRKYEESTVIFIFDNTIFKNMLGFSGWNIIANLTETLKLQGANILINLFFNPSLVAAQAISNQVTSTAMNFVYQFTTAINPQIIKSYAAGDYKTSNRLTLQSTVFVFDLVLLLCLPLFFVIEPLLNIWLVKVPELTAYFIRIALVCQILGVFNVTFYTPMLASGKLKTNSLWGLYLGVGQFVVVYILFKLGFGILWLPYILLLSMVIYSFYIKPMILYKEIDYVFKELFICYLNCFKVLISAILLTGFFYYLLQPETLVEYGVMYIYSLLIVVVCSFLFMENSLRIKILELVKRKMSL